MWYTENVTLWLDVKIVTETVVIALERKNVSSGTAVTMEEFMGSETTVR